MSLTNEFFQAALQCNDLSTVVELKTGTAPVDRMGEPLFFLDGPTWRCTQRREVIGDARAPSSTWPASETSELIVHRLFGTIGHADTGE